MSEDAPRKSKKSDEPNQTLRLDADSLQRYREGRKRQGSLLVIAGNAADIGRHVVVDGPVVVGRDADLVTGAAKTGLDVPVASVEQTERKGTGHAVLMAKDIIAEGFDDIVVLYGDAPLINPDSLTAAIRERASGADVVVLGFRAADPTGYGRLLESDGELIAIREHKEASPEELAVDFCNGGIITFSGAQGVELLEAIGNDNAKGEFYLTDIVEIARALSYDPLIYIMDEPSAALSRVEIQNLYELVRLLKSKGVAIVYISHKLEEVFDLADRVTILRDGYVAGTHSTSDLTMATIVEEMTGRSIEATLRDEHRKPASDGEPLLEVKALTYEPFFEDVSITVPKGKIVGVAGVVGAGKSELARAIFGALPPNALVTGGLRFDGRDLRPSRMAPNKSRSLGIGFVTEDRKAEGFVPGQPVSFNILLPALRRVNALAFLLAGRMSQVVTRAIDEVKLRPRDPGKLVDELSGGNQQKVVIAKWLAAESRLIILDEPTRGIDVGARQEIYELMRKQAAENGAGMLVLSSDMREILVACDEIYLMVQGRIIDKIDPAAVTEHELIEMTLVREGAANVH